MFSYEFCKISQNIFSTEHFRWLLLTMSEQRKITFAVTNNFSLAQNKRKWKQIQISVLVSHTDLIVWILSFGYFFHASLCLVREQNLILIYSSKRAFKCLYCPPNCSDNLIVLYEKSVSVQIQLMTVCQRKNIAVLTTKALQTLSLRSNINFSLL